MRRAWMTAVMTVAAALAAAAGCNNSVVVGSGCPAAMPKQGDACTLPIAYENSAVGPSCPYEDGPCTMTLTCGGIDPSGPTWVVGSSVCTPTAVDCWSASEGDICAIPGDSCGEGGECGYGFLNECGDDHHWHVSETVGGDCCNGDVGACPASPPNEGDPCDPCAQPPDCTYEGFCGGGDASCGPDGIWHTNYSECPPPPMEPCSVYANDAECSSNPSCRWLVPGCMGPNPVATGCYPAADCTATSCDPGLTCQLVDVDPCWNKECNQCSAGASVCLP